MTLPLISSGGSSLVGIGLSLGLLLALTRRRTSAADLETPSFLPKSPAYGSPRSWRA